MIKLTTYHHSPCLTIMLGPVHFHADVNGRFPYGVSAALNNVILDVNAPFGEPSRLIISGPRRQYMIGLLSWHDFKETGRETGPSGHTVVNGDYVRCRPRLVRAQAWDRVTQEFSDQWRWIVIWPHDRG